VQNVFESGSDLIYNGGKMQKFNATLYNAGAVWQLATSSELYAGIAQGVEVSQLGRAYRGQAQIGKPGDPANISAQAAITTQYELGFRARTGPLNATGALFFAKAPLSAQVVPDPSPECRTFPQTRPCPLINLRQRERIWGFEGTAEYTFSPAFLMGGVFTYQNGQSRKDDDTDAKWKRLTTDRITPARLTGYAQFRPMERIKARLQGTHSFDRDGKTPAGFYPYGNYDALDTEVKSFFIMDALVEVDTFGGDLTLGVENLLNKKYFPPLTQVYADLYESSYGEGRRVSLSFKRTF
jgi:iron complex outermembrane receptor protein